MLALRHALLQKLLQLNENIVMIEKSISTQIIGLEIISHIPLFQKTSYIIIDKIWNASKIIFFLNSSLALFLFYIKMLQQGKKKITSSSITKVIYTDIHYFHGRNAYSQKGDIFDLSRLMFPLKFHHMPFTSE